MFLCFHKVPILPNFYSRNTCIVIVTNVQVLHFGCLLLICYLVPILVNCVKGMINRLLYPCKVTNRFSVDSL